MSNILGDKKKDISIMRIVATLGVILLHTCNTITNNLDKYKLEYRQQHFFSSVNYLLNWGVPIFFMISGALLLSKKEITYKECIFKYSKRILLALIVFGVPFSVLELILENRYMKIIFLPEAFLNVLLGKSWGHLWYLYTLVGIYLVLPIFKRYVDISNKSDVKILLFIFFFFDFIFPSINNIFSIEIAFNIPISSFAIFYVLLGKYLYDNEIKYLNRKNSVILCILVGIIIVVFNYMKLPVAADYLNYNSPLIAVLSSGVFCIFKNINVSSNSFLWKIDRLCFGVYLIHPLFINFFYKFLHLTPLNGGKLYPLMTLVFWVFFVICSYLSSFIMSKIKILKKYVL